MFVFSNTSVDRPVFGNAIPVDQSDGIFCRRRAAVDRPAEIWGTQGGKSPGVQRTGYLGIGKIGSVTNLLCCSIKN